MTFKEKLVILRKSKGLTQDEFASAVGVSRQAVYKWESGQSYPEVPKLLEMKLLFTISIDELLDDNYDIPLPDKKKRKRAAKEAAPAAPAAPKAAKPAAPKAAPVAQHAPAAKPAAAPAPAAPKAAPVAPKATPVAQPAPAAKPAAPKAAPKAAPAGAAGALKIEAPMPGTITKIVAKVGDAVKSGDTLLAFEAMKMEQEIKAPQDGVVASINVSQGASINQGDLLVSLN